MRERLHLPSGFHGNVWRYSNPTAANARHHHAELELNLITRGSGTYLLANRRYEIRPGDLLWLFPAQEHVLIDTTKDFEMWIAVFKRSAVKRAATDASERILLQPETAEKACRRLAQHDLKRMEALFAEIAAAKDRVSLLNAGLSYALLAAWNCYERAAEVNVGDVHPAVERAARLIRDGSTRLTLDEIAAKAGLSSARLSRLFKQQTGFAMVDFRNRQRVQQFLAIYGTGQRVTMLDAALEAGFGSYPQFHRVFKSVAGCSPARYRYAV